MDKILPTPDPLVDAKLLLHTKMAARRFTACMDLALRVIADVESHRPPYNAVTVAMVNRSLVKQLTEDKC